MGSPPSPADRARLDQDTRLPPRTQGQCIPQPSLRPELAGVSRCQRGAGPSRERPSTRPRALHSLPGPTALTASLAFLSPPRSDLGCQKGLSQRSGPGTLPCTATLRLALSASGRAELRPPTTPSSRAIAHAWGPPLQPGWTFPAAASRPSSCQAAFRVPCCARLLESAVQLPLASRILQGLGTLGRALGSAWETKESLRACRVLPQPAPDRPRRVPEHPVCHSRAVRVSAEEGPAGLWHGDLGGGWAEPVSHRLLPRPLSRCWPRGPSITVGLVLSTSQSTGCRRNFVKKWNEGMSSLGAQILKLTLTPTKRNFHGLPRASVFADRLTQAGRGRPREPGRGSAKCVRRFSST